MVEHELNKGDEVYLKGKYGMYWKVTIKSIQGEYARVKKHADPCCNGRLKVSLNKLVKSPPRAFIESMKETEKELARQQVILNRLKNC